MRTSNIIRKTVETAIELELNLDGIGQAEIDTGIGFLNHMLELFARHGRFDLRVVCKGDTDVDFHHSTEDIGIALGQAFNDALGDKRGIFRYADIVLPMDEALMMCAVDISGRSALGFPVVMPWEKVGDFDTELVREFMEAFVSNAKLSLHFVELAGVNTHHIIEAMFKAMGRVMSKASSIDEAHSGEIPSTKGVL